jgi:hypothetical protein
VRNGFRTTHFHIITTLLDAEQYPGAEIIHLYEQRWSVELYFRDIKTTMGMDILRCKTPEMVGKEIIMHLIVYNTIRHIMCMAAQQHEVALDRLSFKGALQALRQWSSSLIRTVESAQSKHQHLGFLYAIMTDHLVLYRPLSSLQI